MHTHFSASVLENELVQLRLLQAADFESLYAIASDPLVWEQHPAKDRYKRDVFKDFFEGAMVSGTAYIIRDKNTGKTIGSTRFYNYNLVEKSVAIGFTFLSRAYWGGQYNSSIKKLIMNHAFEMVDTVLFHVGAENIRSQKALYKLGAVKLREMHLTVNNTQVLHYEFGISKNK